MTNLQLFFKNLLTLSKKYDIRVNTKKETLGGNSMNAQQIIEKANRGEGLTVEEVKIYQQTVKPQKQVYGKYGTLALKYMEEHNVGKLWTIENLPEYLHGIDRQADELYETMYAKLSKDERYERVNDFVENYRRQTEIQRLIEEEILNELVYVD